MDNKVRMTEEDQRGAAYEGVWYPTCPYCGCDTSADPDDTQVTCNVCGNIFQIENPVY